MERPSVGYWAFSGLGDKKRELPFSERLQIYRNERVQCGYHDSYHRFSVVCGWIRKYLCQVRAVCYSVQRDFYVYTSLAVCTKGELSEEQITVPGGGGEEVGYSSLSWIGESY